MTNVTTKKVLLSASSYLMASEIVSQGAGFVRNLIVARILEPSDFGVAATIAMVVTFLEIIAGIDIGRYITRSDDKDIVSLVSFAHTAALVRGVFVALILGVSGYGIASFVHMEEYAWAYSAIAIVPFIRGWVHLDFWRKQRDLNFRGYVYFQTIPQLFTLILAFPIANYLGDYRAMLVLVVVNAFIAVVVSHLNAEIPYAFGFAKERLKRLWQYAAPLWLDGLFVFSVLNGERVVIAREFGEYTVGVYSALILIAVIPMGMMSRIGLSIGVPLFVQKNKDKESTEDGYLTSAKLYGILSVGFTVFLGMASSSILVFLYGDAYQMQNVVIALIGVMFSLKMLRGSSTILILVSGKTWATAVSNFIRLVGVFICWFIAVETRDLIYVFSFAVIAEFFALFAAVYGVRSVAVSGIHITVIFCFVNILLGVGAFILGDYLIELQWSSWQIVLSSVMSTLLMLTVFTLIFFKDIVSKQIRLYL